MMLDPIARYRDALAAAARAGEDLPDAATLATATTNGVPSARMVLIKGADERGFSFYTNLSSRKARELAANPVAAMCVH
jgi:pyridoxamine 5'-phosphate oxidase